MKAKGKFGSGVATRGSPSNLKEGERYTSSLTMEEALNMDTAGQMGAGGVKKGVMRKLDLTDGCHGGGKEFPRK